MKLFWGVNPVFNALLPLRLLKPPSRPLRPDPHLFQERGPITSSLPVRS